ncbi:putative bifunctional diguanylate cyclase/phosphodiesterase [Rhizobium rosettiformans]|uniref:putative bifunctional diguanylate cyclase/phosphodiesterase n=1 Tax=Rhizobium rosettiformans TaxID=1368430 RepID=UPI002856E39B|nr:EAL domain-containing protein [Rhizobium rosettiformans]MDR7029723.1 diguanylate cyclase (GGDEF)-like protein [Rhizobium rosettiformans]MDR7063437.1 diguanylate cyclase (GGDEF)-like protein [Rhizobium rosettiformans]
MLEVLTCIAVEHDPLSLIAAVSVCLFGSLLTMRLFGRVRNTRGVTRASWISLTSVIGGAGIWTTHFVAMMGYEGDVLAGYEPTATLTSLVLAIAITGIGFAIAAATQRSLLIEAGGALVGGGIAAMHYVGMSGYQVQGHLEWNQTYVVASLIAGAVFGALATSRVARPVTRFCRYGGGVALVLAIASTHFIGMTAVTIVPDASAALPANMLPESVLTVVLMLVTVLILSIGSMTYVIDRQSTKSAVERYRQLSLHDALTGLPNRSAFVERLGHMMEAPAARADRIYILSFDLDRFKEINDVHGHAAGDHVLRIAAERLGRRLRDGEFVARIGGDEFIAVTSRLFTHAEAEQMAARIIRDLCEPIGWEDMTLAIGTSIGISVFPDNAATIDDLLAQADTAMYRAKSIGSNQICFYDKSMDQAARERSALAMDMRAGLERGEFMLYFQQQNNTQTGEVVGFEVLLRWLHPKRGLVSPVEFIPIAERTGFIMELGDWVLRRSCQEAVKWGNPLRIAVNVAPKQLANANFPQHVRDILKETGLAPERLELEITESGIIADQQNALSIIRQLKAIGVKIAMDDYGTGYSSLSTLQLFPFDKIKIDRGFIDSVVENRQSAAIVRSTLILAQSLNIPVLAEGVENAEHLRFLQDEGCEQVQGYLYGKPQPLSELQAIVNPPASEEQPAPDAGETGKGSLAA